MDPGLEAQRKADYNAGLNGVYVNTYEGQQGLAVHRRLHTPPAPAPQWTPPLPVISHPAPWRRSDTTVPSIDAPRDRAPQTLGAAVKSLAGTGAVLAALYAFFGLHLAAGGVIAWGVRGLLAGAVVAVALWLLVEAIKLAVKILVFILKAVVAVGLVAGAVYLATQLFLGR